MKSQMFFFLCNENSQIFQVDILGPNLDALLLDIELQIAIKGKWSLNRIFLECIEMVLFCVDFEIASQIMLSKDLISAF